MFVVVHVLSSNQNNNNETQIVYHYDGISGVQLHASVHGYGLTMDEDWGQCMRTSPGTVHEESYLNIIYLYIVKKDEEILCICIVKHLT